MKKILVIGGHGFLGRNLQEEFGKSIHDMYYESRRTGWDLSNYEEFKSKLATLMPDIIINAAAYVLT
jgi:dTDP-4-dehydrorhamnose reductase